MSQSLDDAKYLNLATFRKTGARVETPVWFAEEGGKLYVFSAGKAGKIKRLRNSSRVQVAPCGFAGKLRGEWIEGQGQIVEDAQVSQRGYAALVRKYGFQMKLANFFSRLFGLINKRALIEISLG